MKKHSLLAAFLTLAIASFAHAGYKYKYKITVDHTQAGSSDSASFPILVSLSSNDFKTSANGGYIQNTATLNGQTVPADLIVTTDSACATKVTAWEVASYSATGGTVELWVNQGTLSHTADTLFYVCIDNSAVTTYQSTASSVWNSNFLVVLHAPDGSSLVAGCSSSVCDSTANGNNFSNTSVTATTGEIDGAASFGGSAHLDGPNVTAINGATKLTVSYWAKASSVGQFNGIINKWASSSGMFLEFHSTSGDLDYYFTGSTIAKTPISAITTSGWSYNAFVFDGSQSGNSNRFKFYLGQSGSISAQTLTFSGTIPASVASTSAALTIAPADGGRFTGALDEIRVTSAALSADWLTAEYNMSKPSQTMVTIGARQATSMSAHGGQIMDQR